MGPVDHEARPSLFDARPENGPLQRVSESVDRVSIVVFDRLYRTLGNVGC